MARREERAYREYVSDEQRSQPGCPARELCDESPLRDTKICLYMQLLHPRNWARTAGFAHGVAAEGRQVFVAGQVGWNARQEIVSDDFVAQVEQALRNVVDVLAEADARPEHLVRLG